MHIIRQLSLVVIPLICWLRSVFIRADLTLYLQMKCLRL